MLYRLSFIMSLLSRFFYRRPPDGLLELDDRVYGKTTNFDLIMCLIFYILLNTRSALYFSQVLFSLVLNVCSF